MTCILIIDDNPEVLGIYSRILEHAGYEVLVASDGKEGLERFSGNPPDLVITDMVMPGKMGIDLIMEIREKNPEQKIIAMSAGGEFGPEIELSMAEDFRAYTITKPFDPEKALKAVADLLVEKPAPEKAEPDEQIPSDTTP